MSATRELTHADLEGIEPVKCPVCTYPGFVYQTGRVFPYRVPT